MLKPKQSLMDSQCRRTESTNLPQYPAVAANDTDEICEGILCSSFSVEELYVIVHKNYFPCITISNFGHSAPQITSEPSG